MQSRRSTFVALSCALAVSVVCGLLTAVWREGEAAVLLILLVGAALGFAFPHGAWRWAIALALWVPALALLHVPLIATSAWSWCPHNVTPPSVPDWTLALVPFIAVYAGVVTDWVVSQALRWLSFSGWQWADRTKAILRVAVLCGAAVAILASGMLLAQPLHPYGVGQSYCWDEYCFAVMQVKRTKSVGDRRHAVRANGMFYVVTADMETPWWGRFDWSNDAVYAIDYNGVDYRYSRSGQAAVDALTHSRRSSCHKILGAGEMETIVFDLPVNVVQPRLLVRDTLGLEGMLGGLRLNLFYVKPAFNLRYD